MKKLPVRIEIVSDIVCPWCVIGYYRLLKALKKFEDNVEPSIAWLPFELNPQMPAEGQNLREHLAEKYGTTPQESIEARQRLTDLGADVGFSFNYSDDMRMYNTFDAHQLLHWAGEQGKQNELSMRLFEDFFAGQKDVSDREVLAQAASAVGLDPDQAQQVLQEQSYAEIIRELEQLITNQGVQGVPLFIFNRQYAVSGAQEVATFEQQLQEIVDQGSPD